MTCNKKKHISNNSERRLACTQCVSNRRKKTKMYVKEEVETKRTAQESGSPTELRPGSSFDGRMFVNEFSRA